MSYFILDAAGFVAGTYCGPGQPANSTSVMPPENAAIPLRFVGGAWVVAAAAQPPSVITRLAFRRRFTMQERVATEMAALDDPAASATNRLHSAQLRTLIKDLDAAEAINLADEATRFGVQQMQQIGLLTAARVAEILDAPVQDAERPQA